MKALCKLITLFTLCGCSTYPGKFKCFDTKGLDCTMLFTVDTQIKSGEIEEVYQGDQRRKKGCNKCRDIKGEVKSKLAYRY